MMLIYLHSPWLHDLTTSSNDYKYLDYLEGRFTVAAYKFPLQGTAFQQTKYIKFYCWNIHEINVLLYTVQQVKDAWHIW